MKAETRQKLFDYLHKTFGLKMLHKVDMEEIENIILKDYKERLKNKLKFSGVFNTLSERLIKGILKLIDKT